MSFKCGEFLKRLFRHYFFIVWLVLFPLNTFLIWERGWNTLKPIQVFSRQWFFFLNCGEFQFLESLFECPSSFHESFRKMLHVYIKLNLLIILLSSSYRGQSRSNIEKVEIHDVFYFHDSSSINKSYEAFHMTCNFVFRFFSILFFWGEFFRCFLEFFLKLFFLEVLQ